MSRERSAMLQRFEAHDLGGTTFGHEEHVRVAYEMLRDDGFLEASVRYVAAIRAIAASAGVPEKFNMTLTLAFLSLIAERMSETGDCGFDAFIAGNPDLRSKDVLDRWYSQERLSSDIARRQFVLPGEVTDLAARPCAGRSPPP